MKRTWIAKRYSPFRSMPREVRFLIFTLVCFCECQLLEISNNASVQTGAEFVTALRNTTIAQINLLCDVRISDADFEKSAPLLLARNVTVEGEPFDLPESTRSMLDFNYLQQKLILAAGITFTMRNIILVNFRAGTLSASPGFDILAPTPQADDAGPATVVLQNSMIVLRWCYPPSTQDENLRAFTRPASMPGKQVVRPRLDQTGCRNSTDAALPERCWPSLTLFLDFAISSADMNADAVVIPANYTVRMLNVTGACTGVLSQECVTQYGPVGCFFVTNTRLATPPAPAPSLAPGQQQQPAAGPQEHPPPLPAVPPPAWGPVAATLGSGVDGRSDGGERGSALGRRVLLPVLVGVLGGAAVVVMAAAVAVLLSQRMAWRRLTHGSFAAERGGELEVGARPPEALAADKVPQVATDAAAAASCPHGGLQVGPVGPPKEGDGEAPGEADIDGSPEDSTSLFHYRPLSLSNFLSSHQHLAYPPVVVTALSPTRPDLALGVRCGAQVTLLPVLLGKGSFGRVQEGLYGGQRVAVKLLPRDWLGLVDAAMPAAAAEPAAGRAEPAAAAPARQPSTASLAAPTVGEAAESRHAGPAPAIGLPGGQLQQHRQQQHEDERGDMAVHAADLGQVGGVGACCVPPELAAFAQEVEVLGRCCHPNVVRLLAACLGPPQPCLVMELAEGSLERLLHGGRPQPLLPLNTVLRISIDIARGLEYLHPTIVHRDLKPANVLVNMSGSVPVAKITDFGLSRIRHTVLATKHPEAGTPAYMAPECFDTQNLRISHQADIYSLAVIVWEMLTGLQPWWGCAPVTVAYCVALLAERLPLGCLPPQRCPPKLARLLGQCWEAEPRRRPAAAELVKRLQMLLRVVEDEPGGVQVPAASLAMPTQAAVHQAMAAQRRQQQRVLLQLAQGEAPAGVVAGSTCM